MEAYNQKKALKRQGESDFLDRVRDTGNPAASDAMCETPPAAPCSQLHGARATALNSVPLFRSSATQATPPEQEEIDSCPNTDPIVDLSTCSSVVYDERSGVPGVKFVAESHEGWTPVVKGKKVETSDL